jgi:uncharacterized protein (TIGR03492 family)
MRLLCLSNGHGEDTIAIRILQALKNRPDCPTIEALPIVGEGHVYQKAGIPLIGSVKVMPSGGFIYQDSRQLARDLQGGLVQLTLSQIQAVRTWAKQDKNSFILAVGDIVPMLFAWVSSVPFAFVGTAKSNYYIQDEQGELPRESWWEDRIERSTGCIYQPWDRWLMKRPQCKAVFPRDRITTTALQQYNVPAFDLGNPMMDGLEWDGTASKTTLTITLIPGSRPPEVYENWELIVRSLESVIRGMQCPIEFLSAIVPGLDTEILQKILLTAHWQQLDVETFTFGSATLRLIPGRFAACVQRAEVAIALAGTATEQFIGLGKPAIIIPGKGPQFTPGFAEAQTRLLGNSVILVEMPENVGEILRSLLEDSERLSAIAQNGKRRMGEPGAADRIADHLLNLPHECLGD